MESNTDKTPKWRGYFDEHKKVWYDPNVSIYVKAFIRILELHRSDSRGWSISIRRLATLLHISTNTAMDAVDEALKLGFIETDTRQQRKRRKLKLSVSLRAPVEHEKHSLQRLSQRMRQPVSQSDTDSVSSRETVNNKDNLQNANTDKSQVKPDKGIEESNPYKEGVSQGLSQPERLGESEGFRKLREKAKELGWKK